MMVQWLVAHEAAVMTPDTIETSETSPVPCISQQQLKYSSQFVGHWTNSDKPESQLRSFYFARTNFFPKENVYWK